MDLFFTCFSETFPTTIWYYACCQKLPSHFLLNKKPGFCSRLSQGVSCFISHRRHGGVGLAWLATVSTMIRALLYSPPPSFAKPANKPGLHHLGQQRIAQQHEGQIQPEQRRERDEPERGRQRRNRQPGAGRDDDHGSEDERPTGPALDERDFVGANDMDDERLGEERLHKPARLEQDRVTPVCLRWSRPISNSGFPAGPRRICRCIACARSACP